MYPFLIHRLCREQIGAGAVYFTYCKISMSSQDRDYFQCNISSFLSVSMGKVLLLSSGGKASSRKTRSALYKAGCLCLHGAVGWWMQVTRLLLSTCDADGGVITCLKPIDQQSNVSFHLRWFWLLIGRKLDRYPSRLF